MVTTKDAVIEVLRESKMPLHYKEITKRILKNDELTLTSKTPESSVHVIINGDIKKRGPESPFQKTENPGFFVLNGNFDFNKYESVGGSLLSKRKGQEFEEEMKNLLTKLDFDRVEGARDDFVVGGHQIDIAAMFEKNIIVFECKMSQELKVKPLRSIINEFRGKIEQISEGFKKMDYWNKANYFRFVLLVNKNIKIRPEDIELAKKSPHIYIMREEALQYYNELYTFLRPYAKYNLLGELGVRPLHSEPSKVLAFRIKHNEGYMYNFLIDPKELIKLAYVARRERGEEKYYQRIIKKDRLNKIKEYIDSGGSFPNNIIISFNRENDDKIKFRALRELKKSTEECSYGDLGILEFPQDFRSCWIIDGQHRLFSYINSNYSTPIMVTAFQGISLTEQGTMFLDINKNQKPVPTDLVWDLSGELTPDTEDGIISRSVRDLNFKDYSGPLFHKIYFPSLGIRRNFTNLLKVGGFCISIKRAGFGRAVTKSRTKNLFYDENPKRHSNNLRKGISEYYSLIKEVFNEDWQRENKGFVLDDGGAGIMVRLFEKIMEFVNSYQGSLNEDIQRRVLNSSKGYLNKFLNSKKELNDLKKSYFSSESGRDLLLKEICLYIRQDLREENFGGKIEKEDFEEDLKTLERKLGEFLSNILSKKDVNWIKTLLPQDISKQIRSKIKDSEEGHRYLSLGDELKIIEKSDNFPLFEEIFINKHSGFPNKNFFFGAFEHLRDSRNKLVHNTAPLSLEEEKDLRATIEKIEKCLNDYEEQ